MKSFLFAVTLTALASAIDLAAESEAELEHYRSAPLLEMNVYEADDCCEDDNNDRCDDS